MADPPLDQKVPDAAGSNRKLPSDQPPPPHGMRASSPQTNPIEASPTPVTATIPPTKSNKKAESVKSFSSSTSSSYSSSSSPAPPHTAIQVDGGAKASPKPAHAHALPVKDFIYKVPTPLADDHPSKVAAKRQQRRCNPCMRRLACLGSLLLTVVLLLAIAILLFYLIAQPRLPKIDIEALTVAKFNITESSARKAKSGAAKYAGYVSAAMVMRIKVRNINKKMGVRYEDLKGEVWYEGVKISQASMEASSMYQSARNTSSVQVKMHAEKVGLEKKEADSMKKRLAANASIPIHVSTSTNVALQLGAWKSRHVTLHVACSAHVGTAPATSGLVPKSCVASHPKLPFLLLIPSK